MNKEIKKEPSVGKESQIKKCKKCRSLKHRQNSVYCFNCGRKLEVQLGHQDSK